MRTAFAWYSRLPVTEPNATRFLGWPLVLCIAACAQTGPYDFPTSPRPRPKPRPTASSAPKPPSREERDARCRPATTSYEAALLPRWDACVKKCKYRELVRVTVAVDANGHVEDVHYSGDTVCGPVVALCAIDAAKSTPLEAPACAQWSFEIARDYITSQ